MISFRVISKPKPIGDEIYGCVVLVRRKEPKLLFQTFPVEIASAICGESVWHHKKGKDLALCLENKKLLVKMFTHESPLSDQEIDDYLKFVEREPKPGELDVKSALQITVDGETKRLKPPGGKDGQVPEAKLG